MNWIFFILGAALMGVNPAIGIIFMFIGLIDPFRDDD
jgi:hypothetical protein